MLLKSHQVSRELQSRQVVSLFAAAGATLRVTQGTLWITQENDQHDYLLHTGDQLLLANGGQTVLCALDGRAKFVTMGRAHPRRRQLLATLLHWVRPHLRMTPHPLAALHGA